MILQQLGQLLRWSWGYHYLLAKPDKFTISEGGSALEHLENGEAGSRAERSALLGDDDLDSPTDESDTSQNESRRWPESGTLTPQNNQIYPSPSSATLDELHSRIVPRKLSSRHTPRINISVPESDTSDTSEESTAECSKVQYTSPRWWLSAIKAKLGQFWHAFSLRASSTARKMFNQFPPWLQTCLTRTSYYSSRFMCGLWDFMNPPLWAMLAAIIVASIPKAQHYFFTKGTFINTSVARAIDQSGGVAVPLILVVLGANLARNTLPPEQRKSINDDDPKLERKILIASLISRMLLPTLIMAPILALFAKYVPVSIVDDPVFVVVAFLLTGAPSALQLAQICQINNVYVPAMTNLLFQSYVIWYGMPHLYSSTLLTLDRILPSTLILVVTALEVVKWAAV
jgi:predicted permease